MPSLQRFSKAQFAALCIILAVSSPSAAYALEHHYSSDSMMFFAVAGFCFIIWIVTILLVFITRYWCNLYTLLILGVVGLCDIWAGGSLIQNCLTRPDSPHGLLLSLCYFTTGATILLGIYIVGYTLKLQRQAFQKE